ncbi:lipoprotein [Spiroplasma endosymbiont of Glossina fuscipes fuscipes]
MKKILGLLTAITLTSSSVVSVISCQKNQLICLVDQLRCNR